MVQIVSAIRQPDFTEIPEGRTRLGMGVVVMHYMGMSALQVTGTVAYRPDLFSLSVVIALTAATVALWLAANLSKLWQRVAAAVVMAVAICGMHYTGMTGTVLTAAPELPNTDMLVSKGMLAAIGIILYSEWRSVGFV